MSEDSLSREETERGLRAFIFAAGAWGIWGQMIGTGTAVLNGFALTLGAPASFFALMTSVNSLMGFAQLLAPRIGWQVLDHKRFILGCRALACFFRAAILFIPFLLPVPLQLSALIVLVSASLLCLQATSPFYGSWQASLIPEAIRARFTSKQVIVGTLTAMAAGFLVGRYIDSFAEAEKQQGFVHLFALSILVGLASVALLGRAPFPREAPQPRGRHLEQLLQPFKNAAFRRALLFYGALQFALGLADPFYSIFMLDRLQLSYTTISVYNIMAMAASVFGYRLWAGLVDSRGSKVTLALLMVPKILVPVLWVFNTPEEHDLVPVAIVLGGFLSAGISVSITPLLYGLLPRADQRPTYLGCWSASVNLVYSLSTLLGGLVVRLLAEQEIALYGMSLGNLQVVFLLSALLLVIPIFLLRPVEEPRHTPPPRLLALDRIRRALRRRKP